ncbi:MAG: putative bifunctional diguanylate cyclase/phosphodiesterase [Microcystaceae cyanobacterium]
MTLRIFSHNLPVPPQLNGSLLEPPLSASFLRMNNSIAKFILLNRLTSVSAQKLWGYVPKSLQRLELWLKRGNPPTPENSVGDSEPDLVWEMIQAIDQEQFILHYQPQIDLDTGNLLGVETLIRWPHPRLGPISPADFIPIAERTGLIVPIGYWVLKQSCLQYRRWRALGIPPFKLSVNLSLRQLQEEDLLAQIKMILHSTQMNPTELALEVTESLMFKEPEKAIARLNSLKKLGIQIAIDDFGVGYSSLSYLKDLPIHTLKIDKSFINDLFTGGKDQVILQSIIELGHRLTLKIIAEGIESQEQLHLLKQMKCDYGQGYFFSRPLGLPEITIYFQQNATFIPAFIDH